jgi:hypothetical protein
LRTVQLSLWRMRVARVTGKTPRPASVARPRSAICPRARAQPGALPAAIRLAQHGQPTRAALLQGPVRSRTCGPQRANWAIRQLGNWAGRGLTTEGTEDAEFKGFPQVSQIFPDLICANLCNLWRRCSGLAGGPQPDGRRPESAPGWRNDNSSAASTVSARVYLRPHRIARCQPHSGQPRPAPPLRLYPQHGQRGASGSGPRMRHLTHHPSHASRTRQ